MPRQKEPEFFARDELFAQGLEHYARHFEAAQPGQLVGEASTLYSLSPFFPETAARIHATVPGAKLIYVLREPVSRAYSYYGQVVKGYQNETKDYRVNRTFDQFLAPDRSRVADRSLVFGPANAHLPDVPELVLAGSDCPMQIRAYLKHFPRDQMLFLTFDDFVADQAAFAGKVTTFLGLDPLLEHALARQTGRQNVAEDHFRDVVRTMRADGLRQRLGPIWGLRHLVPKAQRRRLLGGKSGQPDQQMRPAPMRPETQAALAARFAAQRPEVEVLTGLDLSSWDRG
jgi:hypothetical protein